MPQFKQVGAAWYSLGMLGYPHVSGLLIQHFVETRFSLLVGGEHGSLLPGWLYERLELLRRFCLPSVTAQTCDAFTWLVFCDESTDPDVLADLRAHAGEVPMLQVVTIGRQISHLGLVEEAMAPGTDVVITTRLDSDDALADEYVATVQEYAESFRDSGRDAVVVNFPRGYKLDAREGRLYDSRMPNSPFHSLLERPALGGPITVFGGGHATMHERYATHQDESLAGWLQVVHGGNLFNRIRPADPERADASAPPGFTLAADAVSPWRPGC